MFRIRRPGGEQRQLQPETHTADAWSRTDPETGLPNRLYLLEAIEREIARLQRSPSHCSLLVVEVEPLTRNQAATVDPGWRRAVASRILLSTRASDIVARIGENHFGVLLVDCPARGAAECAERVRTAISNAPYRPAADQPAVFLASRAGTATWVPEFRDPETFLAAAFDSLRLWIEAYRGTAAEWRGAAGGAAP